MTLCKDELPSLIQCIDLCARCLFEFNSEQDDANSIKHFQIINDDDGVKAGKMTGELFVDLNPDYSRVPETFCIPKSPNFKKAFKFPKSHQFNRELTFQITYFLKKFTNPQIKSRTPISTLLSLQKVQ